MQKDAMQIRRSLLKCKSMLYRRCCEDLHLLQCLDYFFPCLTRVRLERELLVVTTSGPWLDPPFMPDRIRVERFFAVVPRGLELFGGPVREIAVSARVTFFTSCRALFQNCFLLRDSFAFLLPRFFFRSNVLSPLGRSCTFFWCPCTHNICLDLQCECFHR